MELDEEKERWRRWERGALSFSEGMSGERGRVGRSAVDLPPEGMETVAVEAATMGGGERSGGR